MEVVLQMNLYGKRLQYVKFPYSISVLLHLLDIFFVASEKFSKIKKPRKKQKTTGRNKWRMNYLQEMHTTEVLDSASIHLALSKDD